MAEEQKNKKPVTDEIATTSKDVDLFGGWLNRLENPDSTLRTEAKGKGLKLYDEVDRDPHAGSVLQTRYLAVVGKTWDIVPAKSAKTVTTQEQEIADFVKDTLKDTNFEQAMAEILQAILYGFYIGEVIWKIKDNNICISKIRAKHPRRFSFTYDRSLRLLTPENMIEGIDVPERKFLQFTFGSSDNPYGKGLGQKLWWPVWFKKNGIKFWLIFLEKFGMPTAVGKYPSGTTIEQQTALLDAIDAIQNETGVKIPDTMAIDLLEASRSGQASYESLCNYMDCQISKAVLGQTLTTEVGATGSYAASQTHEGVRQDILEADATLLAEMLNESLIPWIVDYNFPDVREYPQFVIRTKPEQDLKPLAERDKILISEIGLPVGNKYIYEAYGIPVPDEGEELIEPQGPDKSKIFEYHLKYGIPKLNEVRARLGLPPIPGGDKPVKPLLENVSPGTAVPAEFSEKEDSYDLSPTDTLNALGEKALDAADMDDLIVPVKKLLNQVNSLEEFKDGLFELSENIDESSMGEFIERALVLAELSGRFDASKR